MDKRETPIPLNRPSIGDDDVARVEAVLRSGWITTGPVNAEFETAFAGAVGAPHAASMTSATGGLHLVLEALGVGPRDEVITPSLTFASTVNQIVLRRATPVFVDVDYGTLNLKVEQVEAKIKKRTKAIIPVHFAGAPCDLDPLMRLAQRKGVPIVEDAAHAVGAAYKGKPVGGHGNAAIFSFHPMKNITTGEGGMVTTHDPELDRHLRKLRFHGIDRDAWKRYRHGGNPMYDVAAPGYKYNLTDLQAALGLAQLAKLDRMNARRAAIAARYREGLAGVPGLDLPAVPAYDHVHAWHLFVVKVTAMSREDFFKGLEEWNVGFGVHFPPCHQLAYVRQRFAAAPGALPETEKAGSRIASLPLYPDMTDADVDYVVAAVRDVLGRAPSA